MTNCPLCGGIGQEQCQSSGGTGSLFDTGYSVLDNLPLVWPGMHGCRPVGQVRRIGLAPTAGEVGDEDQ